MLLDESEALDKSLGAIKSRLEKMGFEDVFGK